MITIVALAVIAVAVVVLVARGVRAENAKSERWAEAMRELGRRCPDCRGIGWHFGPPGTGDPAISTPTCRTCGGSGKLGEPVAAASRDSRLPEEGR
jgi:hypothetical protein